MLGSEDANLENGMVVRRILGVLGTNARTESGGLFC